MKTSISSVYDNKFKSFLPSGYLNELNAANESADSTPAVIPITRALIKVHGPINRNPTTGTINTDQIGEL